MVPPLHAPVFKAVIMVNKNWSFKYFNQGLKLINEPFSKQFLVSKSHKEN